MTGNSTMLEHVLPPGPRSAFPGQHLVAMIRSPLDLLTGAARYGDIVRLNMGERPTYLVNHPDYIRDILIIQSRLFHKSQVLQRMRDFLGDGLLTSEDPLHLRQRKLIQPAFHRLRIAAYARLMTHYALETGERWKDGETRDIHQEMMRLTMVVVGQALFGTNIESETSEIGEAITTMLHGSRRLLLPFWRQIQNLPLPGNRRIIRARLLLDETIRKMVTDRRSGAPASPGERAPDLMDMLLNARDEEGDGQGMSDRLIRDEVLTLFLAGHETTANALTWTWYLLSQNPLVEAKLHEELERVLEGRVPTVEDVDRLQYTRKVISESMRLYPPAWIIGREAQADYAVGGFVLPKGSTILMSQWVMHHDARFYPDPLCFDPERWTPDAAATRPRFAYFPFGGGPRLCVGEPFAWMEAILVLSTLAQQWRLHLDPGQIVAPLPQVTLRPKYGMRMKIERRGSALDTSEVGQLE